MSEEFIKVRDTHTDRRTEPFPELLSELKTDAWTEVVKAFLCNREIFDFPALSLTVEVRTIFCVHQSECSQSLPRETQLTQAISDKTHLPSDFSYEWSESFSPTSSSNDFK